MMRFLLGVYSFWEGFDSGGQSIDSLVITKLPFPNPVSTAQQIIQLEMKEQERSYFLPLRDEDDASSNCIMD